MTTSLTVPKQIDYREPACAPSEHPRSLSRDDIAEVEVWGRKIAMQVEFGNYQAAHAMVEELRIERARRNRSPLLDTPLVEVGVPLRACNSLEQHLGITTVEGLLNTTSGEMLSIPMFGASSVLETMAAVMKYSVNRVIDLEQP